MSGIFLLVVISWSFERIVVDEANTPFHGVWVDKINNDNKYDILGTKYGFSVAVSWYEQTSNIYNWLPHPINTSVAAVELASADLDGDSDRDVVYNASDSSVWVARNDGNGSFINHLITNAGHKLRQIRFADIDGDGDLDFVVGSDDSISPVFWFENMGGLSFIQYTITSDSIFEPWKLDVGDINGDGDFDIAVTSAKNSSNNGIWKNEGDDSFTFVYSFEPDSIWSTMMGWGDYDNDGDPDIALGNFRGEQNRLFKNNGDGTFTKLDRFGDGENTEGTAWSDFDNDGDLDVAVGNVGNDSFVRHDCFGNGDSWGCTWCDVDNDGDLDLAVAELRDTSTLWINEGGGNFTRELAFGTDEYSSVGMSGCDYDEDGDMDIVMEVIIHTDDGGGIYSIDGATGTQEWLYEILPVDNGGGCNPSPAIGDIDGDGIIEIVVADHNGYVFAVSGINGQEKWHTQINSESIHLIESLPALGDVDGDGVIEVIVGAHDGELHSLDGVTGQIEWEYETGDQVVDSPTLGDVDGDGRIDIVVGNNSGTLFVFGNPTTNTPPQVSGIPDRSFVTGDSVKINLDQYVYDAEDPDSMLFWSYTIIGGADSLWVNIDPTHIVTIGAIAPWTGVKDIIFKAEDPGGLSDEDTIKVTVSETSALTVVIHDTSGAILDTINIPIWINDVTGLEIISCDITITFDSTILTALDAIKGSIIPANWMIESNSSPGQIKIGIAGADELSGGGELVAVQFIVDSNAQELDTTTIHFEALQFNEGGIITIAYAGLFTVKSVREEEWSNILLTYDVSLVSNPCARKAVISYQLPAPEKVELKIYDIGGRLVKILVNQVKEAGHHNVIWNTGTMKTGIYFLKFITPNYKATKKLILMK